MKPLKAMIFAAGMGKRLGKITSEIPKALVDLGGKSALQLAVEKLSSHGFEDIIINIHHHAPKMKREIGKLRELGYMITISEENEQLLETAGGLYKARWFFDDRPFLLYNVDVITGLDLNALYDFHLAGQGLATLAVHDHPDYRVFLADNKGLVKGWRNKKTHEEIITGNPGILTEKAFTGIHVADPAIFKFMHEGICSMTTLYLELAATQNIQTFSFNEGFFFDIGTPEDLKNALAFISKQNSREK